MNIILFSLAFRLLFIIDYYYWRCGDFPNDFISFVGFWLTFFSGFRWMMTHMSYVPCASKHIIIEMEKWKLKPKPESNRNREDKQRVHALFAFRIDTKSVNPR